MLLVDGSLMASSLGWSLALGCRPAAVLTLLWYRFGFFLYSLSSFFRRVSASLRFALITMVAMALWHSAGISCSSGGSGSCSTSLACVRVCVGLLGLVVIGVSVFGLWSMLLAAFLSLVVRFSCLVSDFVMGGCSFGVVSRVGGWVIGQICWASR
jgi:hypothetical protein